jgi:next-to-BRCA1 protein 1
VKTLRESFAIPQEASLQIQYTDQDGDLVLLSDKKDFNDAIKVQKLNPLYLEVTVISNEAKTEANTKAKTAAEASDAAPLVWAEMMANWTSGDGKELLRKYLNNPPKVEGILQSLDPAVSALLRSSDVSALLRSPDVMEKGVEVFLQSLNPAVSTSLRSGAGSGFMEKILAGVSNSLAAAAAATNAAAAASSSKTQEEVSEMSAKPAAKETKTEGEDKKAPEATKAEESTEKANLSVHPGVQCDMCNMIPIQGIRYKSLEQHDYDLCQACMDGYPNKKEQFTRIELPLFRPRHHGPGFRGTRCPVGVGGPGGFGGRPFNAAGCGNGPHSRWGGPGFRHWGPSHTNEPKPDARFVKDVTIYDGTEMVPGTPFTKIWRFRNTGTTHWPQGTKIVNVGGDKLSEQESFALQISESGLAPGEEVDVAANLTAPEKPGRYVSHFRLATPQGVRYGHRMWALIHVLDKDEESPLVADSKADDEAVKPSAPAEPFPMKEPEKSPLDDVKEIPVEGADAAAEETVVVVTPSSPKTEPTNLGDDGFMKVEQADTKGTDDAPRHEAVNVTTGAKPVPAAASTEALVSDKASLEEALALSVTAASDDTSAEQVVPDNAADDKAPEIPFKEQLAKLAELGFTDAAKTAQLLEKYEGDLPKTINDLVTINEWDPMMQELEEMGFYDKDLNRSLIYKNNGRLQRVVKDLVNIYKAGPSAQ